MKTPIPLHPVAFGLATACPDLEAILAGVEDDLRRNRAPWQVRGIARGQARRLDLSPAALAVVLGVIDDAMDWNEVAA